MRLWIQRTVIRGSRPQRPFDGSAGLIAVFHALPRLLAPRHPPHALSSLAALIPPSNPCTTRDEAGIAPSYQAHDPGKGGGPRVTILFSLKAHAEFARNVHAARGRAPHGVARESQLLPLPICQRTNAYAPEGPSQPSWEIRRFRPTKDSCFLHRLALPARCFQDFFVRAQMITQTRP